MKDTATPAAARPPHRPLHWPLGCAAALLTVTLTVAAAPGGPAPAAAAPPETTMTSFDLQAIERPRILAKAGRYLGQAPETVTATRCERSAGGPHDFYSEGDYWWPDPENPGGPYIRRDGLTNPDNFVAHRHAMIRLSEIVATLASAYRLTGDERYAADAARHLDAWFVSPRTRMNPSLHYAQAIQGRHTGRSIGLIDTLHLIEVARGAQIVSASPAVDPRVADGVVEWFRAYLRWMNEHEYGQAERDHPNNHGVCWSLQAAAFARLTGDDRQLAWVRDRFKRVYVGEMMDARGGFPNELARTKPYGYSLFMADVMAGVAQAASTDADNLWTYQSPDGRGMRLAMDFIAPYIADKAAWPFGQDVMHWDDWPVRQACLLFAGLALDRPDDLALWQRLEPDPQTPEVVRNLPIRHPLLWVD